MGLFISFEIRDFVYFRDYSITFEGAYRLFLGQIPYRDFGTPVGPVSFIIPAVFFKIFEPSWNIFMLSQQFQNASMLLLVYVLLGRIGVRSVTKLIALATFSVFYLLLLTHPWYNTTGTLFLLGAVVCAIGPKRVSVMGAGLLTGFAVLSKQDFGLLTLLISGVLVSVTSLGSDRNTILSKFNRDFYLKRSVTLSINLLLLVISTAAVIVICILLTDVELFRYWFNHGQEPHIIHTPSIHKLLSGGALGWFIFIFSMCNNNYRLFVASMIIIAATITNNTSGLYFTHYYFVAFLAVVIDECLQIKTRFKVLLVLLVLSGSFAMMIGPFKNVKSVFESVLKHRPEHFLFDYRLLSRATVSFPHELQIFSSHTQAPQQTIDLILELKRMSVELNKTSKDTTFKVLNISELTPIYAELQSVPPIGLPLWFHTNVALFPREIELLEKLLSGQEYDLILIQGTHEGLTDTYKKFFSIMKKNNSYELLQEIKDSPADATWPCEPSCQGYILVFGKSNWGP